MLPFVSGHLLLTPIRLKSDGPQLEATAERHVLASRVE